MKTIKALFNQIKDIRRKRKAIKEACQVNIDEINEEFGSERRDDIEDLKKISMFQEVFNYLPSILVNSAIWNYIGKDKYDNIDTDTCDFEEVDKLRKQFSNFSKAEDKISKLRKYDKFVKNTYIPRKQLLAIKVDIQSEAILNNMTVQEYFITNYKKFYAKYDKYLMFRLEKEYKLNKSNIYCLAELKVQYNGNIHKFYNDFNDVVVKYGLYHIYDNIGVFI